MLPQTLYNARPLGVSEGLLKAVLDAVVVCTPLEIRQELDYLLDRRLISVHDARTGTWRAEIERYGVDIVEYSIACEPGIARPSRS